MSDLEVWDSYFVAALPVVWKNYKTPVTTNSTTEEQKQEEEYFSRIAARVADGMLKERSKRIEENFKIDVKYVPNAAQNNDCPGLQQTWI